MIEMQSNYHLPENYLPQPSALGPNDFLRALPPAIAAKLLGHGRRRNFARGALIQSRGDKGHGFWHIESGTVQIGRYGSDGRLTLFAILGAGDSFGEQAFLGDFPRMVDAIAGSDTVLTEIGEQELQLLLESEPLAARLLLKMMAHMVQRALDLVDSGRNQSALARTAQALLALLGRTGETSRTLSVTQQELADLAGLSRVSLGKMLRELATAGALRSGYGVIEIVDPAVLAEIGGS
ncbi:MAG: Crp/Fnr family transcriptional regulator [Parasphingorhabdus sp.]|nr:Crp/Fnr family transcriptional regulator [Parasphingorhabdus sp.]